MDQHVLEDYLKQVFNLTRTGDRASTTSLAAELGVPVASVSKTLPRLAVMNLIQYDPYRGAVLTDAGRVVALEVVRHHRLLELFLHRALGMTWDEVHGEAERLEHVLSDAMEQRMDAVLGYPTVDPHGDPIPTRDGDIPELAYPSLAEVASGESVTVRRVVDRYPDVLRHLESEGLIPGADVKVVSRSPLEGILRLRVGDFDRLLSIKVAEMVFVECGTRDDTHREESQ